LNATLGVAQRFVPGAVDGWSLAMKELPAEEEAFLDRLERLGEVIGAMHTILASDSEDPAFAPELLGPETLSLLVATMDDEIDALFLRLPDNEVLAPIAGCREAIRDVLLGLPSVGSTGQLTRCHGDLHLGQVLWAQDDWFVVDFEGEPSRSLNERRRKRSPLRDVAGMLRSFSYAASAKEELSATFEGAARARFLAGYESTALGSALAAPSGEATAYLIRIFELEKALYELRYELENRPDWIAVPVAGIVRLLEQAHA
jgi:trehalose synthase-fused probable maltokinase